MLGNAFRYLLWNVQVSMLLIFVPFTKISRCMEDINKSFMPKFSNVRCLDHYYWTLFFIFSFTAWISCRQLVSNPLMILRCRDIYSLIFDTFQQRVLAAFDVSPQAGISLLLHEICRFVHKSYWNTNKIKHKLWWKSHNAHPAKDCNASISVILAAGSFH